jgi:hypothetical protein
MTKISRRTFIRNATGSAIGLMIPGGQPPMRERAVRANVAGDEVRLFIPMPIQVVIDDVGWWSGEDGSSRQEPYRTGINRNHVPADYQAIADLGRALGIRPQAAFVLCEWDKENILRQLPTSTWMGNKWDNSRWIGPWLEEAADIIRKNQKHLEITIHGIGHEYWEGGGFTRAEWTDSQGQMRPRDQVELHLEYFGRLMNQHDLGPFPESFVPAAFRHSFGPSVDREVSLAEILKNRGVNYINTPFSSMYHRERAEYKYFGFDSGVMTIDRGEDEFPWLTFPADPSAELTGPTCGMHWPNMLHPAPERNSEVVERWVNYLRPFDKKPGRMLAPDSAAFQHQMAHHTLTKVKLNGNLIELDFTATDQLPRLPGRDELTIKVLTEKPGQFTAEGAFVLSQSLQEGTDHLYILNLERKTGVSRARIRWI